MLSHMIVLIFIFFTYNTSHTMEIVKQKPKNDSPINKVFLLTHIFNQKDILPRDILNMITLHGVRLADNDFGNNQEEFKKIWQNHNIPMHYYYSLTSKQKKLMCNITKSQTTIGSEVYYQLDSVKHSNLVYKLPMELDLYITLVPPLIECKKNS